MNMPDKRFYRNCAVCKTILKERRQAVFIRGLLLGLTLGIYRHKVPTFDETWARHATFDNADQLEKHFEVGEAAELKARVQAR